MSNLITSCGQTLEEPVKRPAARRERVVTDLLGLGW